MPKYTAGLGDQIEVAKHHRLAGETGTIVAVGDNPHSAHPTESFHVRFDRTVWGTVRGCEIWIGRDDFVVLEKAPADYEPPIDIEKPGAYGDE